jgi:hypothetical protein
MTTLLLAMLWDPSPPGALGKSAIQSSGATNGRESRTLCGGHLKPTQGATEQACMDSAHDLRIAAGKVTERAGVELDVPTPGRRQLAAERNRAS